MLTAKFDPQSFFQHTQNLALHVPASEVFSLLKRSIDLPPQWGALVRRRTGGPIAIAAGGVIESTDVDDILFIRLAPAEIKFRLERLSSRDGFSFDADVLLRVEPIADRAELAGFLQEVVGSRRVVQAEGLSAQVKPVAQGALATFASQRDAVQLADAAAWHEASETLAKALDVPMFKAGLSLEAAPVVGFESAMFRNVQKAREDAAARQAQHEASRQVSEALHAARAEHLDRVAQSLARLKELAAQSPHAELAELVRTFSEPQRGPLYEALFATATHSPKRETQWIVVACGEELLFFDARNPVEPSRRLRVEGAAGPARSVRKAENGMLLVGAARGVYAWPMDRVAPERAFLVADAPPVRGGFNAAVRAGDVLAATHSELGICEWNWTDGKERGARFKNLTQKAKAVRDITRFDGACFCSIDNRVIQWRENCESGPETIYDGCNAMISAIEPGVEGVYAGTSEGNLLFWPSGITDDPQLLHRGLDRPVESVWSQRSHGVRRIVFTDTSSRVHARVVGDNFTFHYEAGGQTLRRVEVASDLLVATNDVRDRLICWSPERPSQPSHIIHIGKLSGRNIQDVCLVAADPSA